MSRYKANTSDQTWVPYNERDELKRAIAQIECYESTLQGIIEYKENHRKVGLCGDYHAGFGDGLATAADLAIAALKEWRTTPAENRQNDTDGGI